MEEKKQGGNKYIKAGIGYTIGNYLIKGLSFFTIPIFARLMDPANYGIFNTFASYEAIFYIILCFAIHTSFKNARYKYKTTEEGAAPGWDFRTYVSNAYTMMIISMAAWYVIAAVFRKPLTDVLGIDTLCLFLLIIESFTSAVIKCYNADISLKYSYGNFIKVAGFNAVGNIVLSILIIVYIFPEKSYLGRIIGVIIPLFLSSTYILINQFRETKADNFGSMMKWGLKYSIPIVPHGISQIVLNSFDRIMIKSMVSASSAGLYSFAYNVYSIVAVTATSLDTVWEPWFYEKKKKNEEHQIRKYSSIYVVLIAAMCSGVMFLSPEIIKILGTKAYYESVYCVIPIVAGGFFAFMYALPASVEYYYEKTGYIASATTLAALINIALNYVIIKRYGYVGAAYTTLITYILYFVFHYIIAIKIEGKCLFSTKTVLLCSGWILLMTFVAVSVVEMMFLRLAVTALIGAAVVLYEEKNIGFLKKILGRINKK